MSENFLGRSVEGISNASYWAHRMVEDIRSSRVCGIAIANDTRFVLGNPQRYTSSGKLLTLPFEIPPAHTGLMAAAKTAYGFRGTVGVITYEMLNHPIRCNLQLMWHVPYDYSLYKNFLNVDFGIDVACKTMLSEMYSADKRSGSSVTEGGFRVLARDTPHTFEVSYLRFQGCEATAVMEDAGRSVLVVTLKGKAPEDGVSPGF